MTTELSIEPPALADCIYLPDQMPAEGATASYDQTGKPDLDGNVTITTFAVQFVWARFLKPIRPGQTATMIFNNMPQLSVVIDGAATEWDTSINQPTISEAIVELVGVEQGMRRSRITCRNTHNTNLHIAVGLAAPISLGGVRI